MRVVDTDIIADTDTMGTVDVDADAVAEAEDIMHQAVVKTDGTGSPTITVVRPVTSAKSVRG